jgi:hypothetical protein
MWWMAWALAAPDAGYGFEEDDGSVAFDALGAAHGCLDGEVERGAGLHGQGLQFTEGSLRLPLAQAESLTLGLQLRSLGDGTVLDSGALRLVVGSGRLRVEGLATLDGGLLDAGWHHVAVGAGSGVVKLFVDGVEVGSGPASGSTGAELVVGSASDGTTPWLGDVDDLTVTLAFPDAAVAAASTEVDVVPMEGADCGDYDYDGLDDAVELTLGTDPEQLDSDGDSFPDGLEVGDVGAPTDTDGDGLIDALDDDDDGDGLPSLDERVADADGDGSPDLDPDGDGLDNGVDLDSDGDGVPDAEEGFTDSDLDGIADFVDAVDDPAGSTATSPSTTASETTGRSEGKGEGCGCTSNAATLPPWWVGLAAASAFLRRRPRYSSSCM